MRAPEAAAPLVLKETPTRALASIGLTRNENQIVPASVVAAARASWPEAEVEVVLVVWRLCAGPADWGRVKLVDAGAVRLPATTWGLVAPAQVPDRFVPPPWPASWPSVLSLKSKATRAALA